MSASTSIGWGGANRRKGRSGAPSTWAGGVEVPLDGVDARRTSASVIAASSGRR